MSIKLKCACGKALSIKDELAGRRVKCPGCQTLLRVPKPKVEEASFGDEWDLGDESEQDFDDKPRQTRAKSRGGRSLPQRGSNSRQTSGKGKGKKPQSSKRGLMIGLSAGGGLLVIALVAWMLWPESEGANVAVAPNQNTAGSPVTTSGDSTTSTNTASLEPSTQQNAGPPSPSPPTAAIATKLDGDLNFLQGTWQVTHIEMPPSAPGAAEALARMKLMTFTIKDDMLTITTSDASADRGASFQTIKIDSLQTPKRIDLTPLETSSQNRTQLAIYSIEGETWRMCSTQGGIAPPQEMKAAPGQMVMTFQRSTAPPAAPTTPFDSKAWLAAESKLKAMKVNASMVPWTKFAGIEGPTHFVALTIPETPEGTMSPELWAIVSSISHIAVRTSFATDALLRQLAQHPGLLGINVDTRSTVTADGIVALKGCTQLQILIFHAPASPEVCGACSQLSRLRLFGIGNPIVSKELLASIIQLSQIESLSLQNTGITDNDLLSIQKMTKLKTLLLDNAKVTDEGLKTLKSFTGLTRLGMMGLNVTPQAVAELEAALPNCKVQK